MVFAPGQVIFQDDRSADRVQDGLALFAKGAALAEEPGGGDGGLPLVPHPDGQAAFLPHQLGQFAAFFGPRPLGAVHVAGQADDDQPGAVLPGRGADLGRHLGHGLFLDLGPQGGGEDLAGVADGQAGAAVAVIYC